MKKAMLLALVSATMIMAETNSKYEHYYKVYLKSYEKTKGICERMKQKFIIQGLITEKLSIKKLNECYALQKKSADDHRKILNNYRKEK